MLGFFNHTWRWSIKLENSESLAQGYVTIDLESVSTG